MAINTSARECYIYPTFPHIYLNYNSWWRQCTAPLVQRFSLEWRCTYCWAIFRYVVVWTTCALSCVTTRAAAFCNLWSLDNWYAGMPYRRALSWYSHDVIKTCTKHSAESAARYFLIMPMFLSWKWPALHIELIWAPIFMCSSNMMPRLRTCFTEWMKLSPIVAEGGAVMVWLSFLVM